MIAVLQFDSASASVLARMRSEGKLPVLAALEARGRRIELATPAQHFAAGAFYTLYSGVEIGEHGIFYPFQWDPAEQRIRYVSAFEAPPPVWELLANRGRRSLIIDPYESRPPRSASGILACGVGFTDRVVLPKWSVPAGEGRRIERRIGRSPSATEVFGRPDPRRLARLRESLLDASGRVAATAADYLRRSEFDLVWLTFSAAHLAGHQCWDLSTVSRHGLERHRAALTGALEEIYAAVDAAFGEVLEGLPAGADVIVTSPVGMEANASRAEFLPAMLDAVLRGGVHTAGDAPAAGAIWRLRGALPPSLRSAVAGVLPRRAALALTARLELRGIDWSTVKAFAHPADNQGYVRLNLRGRERDGIVAPDQADALLAEITTGLESFREPDGSPAVAAVERVGDLYPGEHAGRLPDLVVRWSDRPSADVERLDSERFGAVFRAGAGSGRSGNHTGGDAWAVIASGRSEHRDPGRPARLEDIAATVLAACGIEADQLRGEPLLADSASAPPALASWAPSSRAQAAGPSASPLRASPE